jgi:hypothetical protein
VGFDPQGPPPHKGRSAPKLHSDAAAIGCRCSYGRRHDSRNDAGRTAAAFARPVGGLLRHRAGVLITAIAMQGRALAWFVTSYVIARNIGLDPHGVEVGECWPAATERPARTPTSRIYVAFGLLRPAHQPGGSQDRRAAGCTRGQCPSVRRAHPPSGGPSRPRLRRHMKRDPLRTRHGTLASRTNRSSLRAQPSPRHHQYRSSSHTRDP